MFCPRKRRWGSKRCQSRVPFNRTLDRAGIYQPYGRIRGHDRPESTRVAGPRSGPRTRPRDAENALRRRRPRGFRFAGRCLRCRAGGQRTHQVQKTTTFRHARSRQGKLLAWPRLRCFVACARGVSLLGLSKGRVGLYAREYRGMSTVFFFFFFHLSYHCRAYPTPPTHCE